MYSFLNTPAYKKLVTLSQNPFDLTQEGSLDGNRVKKMQATSCGIKLLFATERLSIDAHTTLKELAKESLAVEWMHKMQRGEIVNRIEGHPSENRAVLHTAMRDVFEDRSKEGIAGESATKAKRELDKLSCFLQKIDQGLGYTDLIQIGIGGSDLGPRALYLSLQPYVKNDRKVHFVSNVDPDDLSSVLKKVNLSKTLVVIVSKSGTTLETKTNEEMVRFAYSQEGLNPDKYCIAVTGEKSPMDDPSRYLETFYIWDYVGGRYSSTSMVGGVTLSFAFGLDIFIDILKGAHEMDQAALSIHVDQNLPLLGALIGIWNHNFLHIPTLAVVPYSQALIGFPAHLQQCDMESNGKSIDREGSRINYQSGPVLWGEVGTNGQHSFFQWLHQGTQLAALEMIGFKQSQYGRDIEVEKTLSQEKLLSNLFAQSIALATGKKDKNPNKVFEGNRPNHLLLAKRLDPLTLGKLLAYYEHKIAFQGFIWNINSFDQEGVQYGKILADKILSVYKARKEDREIEYALGDAFIQALESL